MKDTWPILALAVLFGCLFWVADAVYEYYMFAQNLRFMLFQEPLSFWDSLVLNVPTHAMISRVVFLVACLAGGLLASWLVSRTRSARAQLLAQQRRYQTYVSNAPDAIVVLDREGAIEDANPAMARLAASEETDLPGRNFLNMLRDGPVTQAGLCRQRLLERETFQAELRLAGGGDEPVDITLSAAPIGEDQMIVFVRDVTEVRRLEQQLHQNQKLESLGRLAGGIAHDFNNLLTGILGNAQLIQMTSEEQDKGAADELAAQAGEIISAASRASELTRQLLGFARKGRLTTTLVDLHASIEEVRSLLAHSLDRQVEMRVDLQAGDHHILGDYTQIQNALLNLGVNARDAMPSGGMLVFSTRNVDLDEAYCNSAAEDISPGRYVEICVTDTGEGMDPATQQQIFEPFFTTKEPGRGTGLGLASVYGAVSSHRGVIRVYSEPGRGTTMKLLLPASRADIPQAVPATNSREIVRGQGRVLLIDDEEVVLRFAGGALRTMGYEVVSCSNGPEALEKLQADPDQFDLVVLDLIMPEMPGSETFKRIRQIRPDLPVVVSTGYSSSQALRSTLDQGAEAFLPKPYRLDELSRVIAQLVKARQADARGT